MFRRTAPRIDQIVPNMSGGHVWLLGLQPRSRAGAGANLMVQVCGGATSVCGHRHSCSTKRILPSWGLVSMRLDALAATGPRLPQPDLSRGTGADRTEFRG